MPLRALLDGRDYWWYQLGEGDRGKPFKCPICGKPFVVVLPVEGRIKHFRHKSGRDHWEPETAEHLEVKLAVHRWALLYGYAVKVEPFFSPFFADVSFGGYVVECQCSGVSVRRVREKDEFYLGLGLKPFWVLGGEFWRNVHSFRWWSKRFDGYRVQRVRSVEVYLLERYGRLVYYGDGGFWFGGFRFRSRSRVLGWYNVRRCCFGEVLWWLRKVYKC
jgi:hypothetical protein